MKVLWKDRNSVIFKPSGHIVLKGQHNTHIPYISCECYGHNPANTHPWQVFFSFNGN